MFLKYLDELELQREKVAKLAVPGARLCEPAALFVAKDTLDCRRARLQAKALRVTRAAKIRDFREKGRGRFARTLTLHAQTLTSIVTRLTQVRTDPERFCNDPDPDSHAPVWP